MNPQPYTKMYHSSSPFDEKSLGFCVVTIILNAGPQLPNAIASLTSLLTGLAAVSTVSYNMFRLYMDYKNNFKKDKN